MQLCSGRKGPERHDEVCYEGGICPACERWDEIEKLMAEIRLLQKENNDLEEALNAE